jgi:hypothetical protein
MPKPAVGAEHQMLTTGEMLIEHVGDDEFGGIAFVLGPGRVSPKWLRPRPSPFGSRSERISGKALETIRANPVRGQRTAPLLGQVLTLLKANLAAADDLLDFNVTPLPIINCANGELAEFYAAYAEWTRRMGYTLAQNQQAVSLDLQHLGFAATTSRGTVFRGLALTTGDGY